MLSISRLPINGINRNILECKDGKKVVYRSNGLVLIETYWNVKACNLSRITAISRINRNILECKVVAIPKNALTHIRINRNILECKEFFPQPLPIRLRVLIETYWNVKALSAFLNASGSRINRNILECKD